MNARAQPGAGTVDQLPSGNWRVRVTVSDGSRRPLGSYATEDEAKRVLSAALVELAEGNVAPVGGITLRAFGAIFLDRREKRGIRNIRTDRSRWKVHVDSAPFADFPLVAITGRMVRDWRDELSRKRAADLHQGARRQPRVVSEDTVRHCVNLLRRGLQEAVEDEIIATNPARDVRVARRPKTHEKWTYLTLPEQQAIEQCSAPEADRLLAMFAIGTGLRQGEQWSLELVDVHRDAKEPHVVVRYGARGKKPRRAGSRAPYRSSALALARSRSGSKSFRPTPRRTPWASCSHSAAANAATRSRTGGQPFERRPRSTATCAGTTSGIRSHRRSSRACGVAMRGASTRFATSSDTPR